jgi:hypothetical protein
MDRQLYEDETIIFTNYQPDDVSTEGDQLYDTTTGELFVRINNEWVEYGILADDQVDDVDRLMSIFNIAEMFNDPINSVIDQSFEEDTALIRNDKIELTLSSTRYKKTNKETKTCSICQEHFRMMDSVCELDCKHLYHQKCIQEWGKYKQDCPTCRKPISNNQLKI